MLFNDGGFFDLGIGDSFGVQHDVTVGYAHSIGTILSSRFYGEPTRDSRIVINYSDQPDDIRKLVDNFVAPNDSQLILGRQIHFERICRIANVEHDDELLAPLPRDSL